MYCKRFCWYYQEVTGNFVAVLGIARIEQVVPAVYKYTATSNIRMIEPKNLNLLPAS